MLALSLILASLQVPGFDPQAYLAAHRAADAALLSGRAEEAREGFERCLALSPDNANVAYGLACAAARSGKSELALGQLECAVQWGFADAELAAWDEDLASLREEQRFSDSLRRMRELSASQTVSAEGLWIQDQRSVQRESPDVAVDRAGRWVVVARTGGVLDVLDAKSGHLLRSSPKLGAGVEAVEFDISGERVAALTWEGQLRFWNLSGDSEPSSSTEVAGQPSVEFDVHFNRPLLQFSRGGERLLLMDGRRSLLSLRTAKGEIVRYWRLSFGLGHQAPFAWSPDGACIALADGSRIAFFDGRSGEESSRALAMPTSVGCLAFGPSGKFLATGHRDGRVRVWDLKTRALSFEKQLMTVAGLTPEWDVDAVAFSPDGRFLAFGIGDDCGIEVLEVSTRTRVRGFECTGGLAGIPREMRWSGDSRRLWFNLCKEGNEVNNVAVGEDLTPSFSYWGSSPRVSGSGAVVALGAAVVFSLDAKSGRCLWIRPDLAREGEILQAPTGHFSGEVYNFDGLTVGIDDVKSPQHALAKSVAILFDPKRVRAARAGVELLPAKL